MKNYHFILIVAILSFIISCNNREVLDKEDNIPQYSNVTYELYPTTNMWIFIKLDTRNGKMRLVQFSINDDDKRFETVLNNRALVSVDKEVNGRFKLQPTQNIYTFILLDQIEGRTWQVQWSFDEKERFVIPIN